MLGIFLASAQLAASQEGLSSVELVSTPSSHRVGNIRVKKAKVIS
jgi:hypothetical protein